MNGHETAIDCGGGECWPCTPGKRCEPGHGVRDCLSGHCIPLPVVNGVTLNNKGKGWAKNDSDVGNWTEFFQTRNRSTPALPYYGTGSREAPPWLHSYDEAVGAMACDVASLIAPESVDMMGVGPTCSWVGDRLGTVPNRDGSYSYGFRLLRVNLGTDHIIVPGSLVRLKNANDASIEREHEPNGQFGYRHRVFARTVGHINAPTGTTGQIDRVDARSGAHNQR